MTSEKEARYVCAFWSSGQHGHQAMWFSTLMSVTDMSISLFVSVLISLCYYNKMP